jgi:antitoxin (DNA-binding transcriptional repressor) of toxin-antitoxin stability system
METISISALKAHLSAKIKEVRRGQRLIVLDHKQPVAMLSSLDEEPLFVKEAEQPYSYKKLAPLTDTDPVEKLKEERKDRW